VIEIYVRMQEERKRRCNYNIHAHFHAYSHDDLLPSSIQ